MKTIETDEAYAWVISISKFIKEKLWC